MKKNKGSDDIQLGLRDEIWHRKIYHGNNEKRKTINDERNRITKSRKNKNAQRKEKLEALGNIRSEHHQINGGWKKEFKKSMSGERENYTKPNYIVGTYQ